MEFVNIRDFKTHATRFMKEGKTLLVTRNGKPAGVFVPWEEEEIGVYLQKAVLEMLMESMSAERKKLGVSEEEVLDDFSGFKKNSR